MGYYTQLGRGGCWPTGRSLRWGSLSSLLYPLRTILTNVYPPYILICLPKFCPICSLPDKWSCKKAYTPYLSQTPNPLWLFAQGMLTFWEQVHGQQASWNLKSVPTLFKLPPSLSFLANGGDLINARSWDAMKLVISFVTLTLTESSWRNTFIDSDSILSLINTQWLRVYWTLLTIRYLSSRLP